jgi:exopolyphosphatase/guanosine-5'-triphosphate,3'-diphosphate pyrophosphatase
LLIKNKSTKKLAVAGLKEDRIPVIAGGLSIMTGVMEELNIETMTIADGSLREGVMYDLLGRKTNHDLRESTVARLKKRYLLDNAQSDRVAHVTLGLYQHIIDKSKQDKEQTKLLQWAAQLYETGLSISHNDYHKHGAYVLANAELAGFSKPEQTLLADLVRSHRGGLNKALECLKNKRRVKSKLMMMVLCFRLAVIFNRNRKDIPEDNIIQVQDVCKDGFSLLINGKWLKHNPLTLYSLNEEIDQWKKVNFKVKLVTA